MLSRAEIDDLIHLRLNESQARALLQRLTVPALLALNEPGAQIQTIHEALLASALPLPALQDPALQEGPLMDCCGTGGSGRAHFNTSTTAAFVLAAGGVPVVKFGNRAVTSVSGSFDLLEALGVKSPPLARLPETLARCGIVFLYAPDCYPALGPFHQLRRALGVPTVFNLLGPLLNPVKPAYRLMGVSDPTALQLLAPLLAEDPALRRAWLVNGFPDISEDPIVANLSASTAPVGVDELVINGLSTVFDITPGAVDVRMINRFHAEQGPPADGYSPQANARLCAAILSGEDTLSDAYHMVCLNAGAGLAVFGAASDLEAGVAMAAGLLASGKAQAVLNRVRQDAARA
ncbi:MAG: anthranilate phosphoribosyltransferase [Vampirovibrionales bacterium]|nr:anthranilate phosphoribosyltransferase [Vampirovibrionales bacterium]